MQTNMDSFYSKNCLNAEKNWIGNWITYNNNNDNNDTLTSLFLKIKPTGTRN